MGLQDKEQTFSLEHQSECRVSDGNHAIFEKKKKKSGNLPELKSKEAHSLPPPPDKNKTQQKRAAKIKRNHLNTSQ